MLIESGHDDNEDGMRQQNAEVYGGTTANTDASMPDRAKLRMLTQVRWLLSLFTPLYTGAQSVHRGIGCTNTFVRA